MKQNTVILGIDPGSRVMGYAFIEMIGRKPSYLCSGVYKFSTPEFLCRLSEIRLAMDEILKKVKPDEVAFESLIYVKSPSALIKLAQARGVILGSCYPQLQGKIFEYAPNLIKSVCAGHGHAQKENVQKGLTLYFGKRQFKTHDESDALAVALCHGIHRIQQRRNKVLNL